MQNITEGLFKKIENQLLKIEKENKQENEIIKNSINVLKQSFEVNFKNYS